jgi:hypothetical protein
VAGPTNRQPATAIGGICKMMTVIIIIIIIIITGAIRGTSAAMSGV